MMSRQGSALRRAVAVAFAGGITACASLPTLSFDQDSGVVDATDAGLGSVQDDGAAGDTNVATPTDSSSQAVPDAVADTAPVIDAAGSDTGPGADSGSGGLCLTGTPPAGADACCALIPCVGKKCTTRCPDCETACTVTQVCCVPNGNGSAVTCATSVAGCN